MKAFLFLLCFGCINLCISQSNDPMPQTEEERQIILKNKVKSYSVTVYEMINKSKKKTGDLEKVEYDEEGYMIKEEWGWREPQDVNIETTTYTYNEKKQLVQEFISEFDFDGEVKETYLEKTLFEYDKDGNLVKDCWYTKEPGEKDFLLEDCITYEYINGKLVSETNDIDSDTYTFENRGDTIIKRETKTNQIISKEVNGNSVYLKLNDAEWYFFYNSEKLLIKSELWKSGILDNISEMEYKKKLLHRITHKNKNFEILEIQVFAYQYYK